MLSRGLAVAHRKKRGLQIVEFALEFRGSVILRFPPGGRADKRGFQRGPVFAGTLVLV